MVMKHHRHFGYDFQCQQLLNLLLEENKEISTFSNRRFIEKQKAEYEIINRSLWAYKHTSFQSTCTDVRRGFLIGDICPHLDFGPEERPARLCITAYRSRSIKDIWSILLPCADRTNLKEAPMNLCSEFHPCQYCRTAYKASFEHNNGCMIKFTIEIWKDLGKGPETKKRKEHCPPDDIPKLSK